MREILAPPLRTAAICALVTGLVLLVIDPLSLGRLSELLALILGAILFVLIAAAAMAAMTRGEMPEPEFRRLVDRSEALAALPPPERPPSEFDELVIEFLQVLERTPVVVSSRGREQGAYGLYVGGTVARDSYPDRIVIYQDTLERDFGHDPDLLRGQVERTVRHEIAHHLGWDEPGVRGLGL